jgi:hypothetical protein
MSHFLFYIIMIKLFVYTVLQVLKLLNKCCIIKQHWDNWLTITNNHQRAIIKTFRSHDGDRIISEHSNLQHPRIDSDCLIDRSKLGLFIVAVILIVGEQSTDGWRIIILPLENDNSARNRMEILTLQVLDLLGYCSLRYHSYDSVWLAGKRAVIPKSLLPRDLIKRLPSKS